MKLPLFEAGDSDHEPPLPQGGIPPQRVPGWIRWPIRALLLPFVLLDLLMQCVAKLLVPPPYKKGGGCLKRGKCCHYILMRKPKGLLGWFFLFWNREFHGFYLRSPDPHDYDGTRVMVMGCRYLQPDGRCGHYFLRPMVCRKWPLIEQFGQPRLLKGCGFKPIPREIKKGP